MEELERKTEEKTIQKKELRRKIKEKLSFTTEKYRKEADRKITESVLELKEYSCFHAMRLFQISVVISTSVTKASSASVTADTWNESKINFFWLERGDFFFQFIDIHIFGSADQNFAGTDRHSQIFDLFV
mgnify:CR=1 FL=1